MEPTRAAEVAAVGKVALEQAEGGVVRDILLLHDGVGARRNDGVAQVDQHVDTEDVTAVVDQHLVASGGRTDVQVIVAATLGGLLLPQTGHGDLRQVELVVLRERADARGRHILTFIQEADGAGVGTADEVAVVGDKVQPYGVDAVLGHGDVDQALGHIGHGKGAVRLALLAERAHHDRLTHIINHQTGIPGQALEASFHRVGTRFQANLGGVAKEGIEEAHLYAEADTGVRTGLAVVVAVVKIEQDVARLGLEEVTLVESHGAGQLQVQIMTDERIRAVDGRLTAEAGSAGELALLDHLALLVRERDVELSVCSLRHLDGTRHIVGLSRGSAQVIDGGIIRVVGKERGVGGSGERSLRQGHGVGRRSIEVQDNRPSLAALGKGQLAGAAVVGGRCRGKHEIVIRNASAQILVVGCGTVGEL